MAVMKYLVQKYGKNKRRQEGWHTIKDFDTLAEAEKCARAITFAQDQVRIISNGGTLHGNGR